MPERRSRDHERRDRDHPHDQMPRHVEPCYSGGLLRAGASPVVPLDAVLTVEHRNCVTSQIWPKGSRCPQNSQQQGRPVMSNPISSLSIPHTAKGRVLPGKSGRWNLSCMPRVHGVDVMSSHAPLAAEPGPATGRAQRPSRCLARPPPQPPLTAQ
eukprot:CAMPEP_0180332276 /NCGR_PEP_ID=MMETSP0988-20121125/42434_1 /TAXON_ID=697907 /ORGANISM="non described non described, Strain CCMP2293" /LENGTH=154 /DNA_ID=CAMNT_0022319887 /DNA_START=137 /DNA_END=599 /DNA_ORIENTATION=+